MFEVKMEVLMACKRGELLPSVDINSVIDPITSILSSSSDSGGKHTTPHHRAVYCMYKVEDRSCPRWCLNFEWTLSWAVYRNQGLLSWADLNCWEEWNVAILLICTGRSMVETKLSLVCLNSRREKTAVSILSSMWLISPSSEGMTSVVQSAA